MSKKVLPLSDVQVRNAKPQAKLFTLSDGGGLFLAVLPTGGKSWRFKYNFQGKEKRLVFGLYPDVSLVQARKLREDARAMVANGIDPDKKRKQDEAEIQAQTEAALNTFEKVAREWHTRHLVGWSAGHAARVLSRMERFLFPAFGAVPIAEIRPPVIRDVLHQVEDRGHHDTAHILRQYCEAVFTYAVASDLTERNVAADLRGTLAPCRTKSRPAIIDPKGVGELLRAIDGYTGSPVTLAALKLSAILFVRPGELRQMEWSEIDLDALDGSRWSIPAEKMKMRAPHVVPLPRQAVAILADVRLLTGAGKYVFPSARGPARPMSNMTINAALRRLGYEQGEHCAHGFRAMASTLLNESGQWPRDVIELQLAHQERNKVRAAYNRAEHLPERRKMMQWWSDRLDALKAGPAVIPLHQTEAAVA